jgi:hypothetical protein
MVDPAVSAGVVAVGSTINYASLTIAMTIPASTKTTISACVQSQNGDTAVSSEGPR